MFYSSSPRIFFLLFWPPHPRTFSLFSPQNILTLPVWSFQENHEKQVLQASDPFSRENETILTVKPVKCWSHVFCITKLHLCTASPSFQCCFRSIYNQHQRAKEVIQSSLNTLTAPVGPLCWARKLPVFFPVSTRVVFWSEAIWSSISLFLVITTAFLFLECFLLAGWLRLIQRNSKETLVMLTQPKK